MWLDARPLDLSSFRRLCPVSRHIFLKHCDNYIPAPTQKTSGDVDTCRNQAYGSNLAVPSSFPRCPYENFAVTNWPIHCHPQLPYTFLTSIFSHAIPPSPLLSILVSVLQRSRTSGKCVCLSASAQSLGHVWVFETAWAIASQALLSMEFSRQEYWSGLLFPSLRASSWPRSWTRVSYISCIGRILYWYAIWEVPSLSVSIYLSRFFISNWLIWLWILSCLKSAELLYQLKSKAESGYRFRKNIYSVGRMSDRKSVF